MKEDVGSDSATDGESKSPDGKAGAGGLPGRAHYRALKGLNAWRRDLRFWVGVWWPINDWYPKKQMKKLRPL